MATKAGGNAQGRRQEQAAQGQGQAVQEQAAKPVTTGERAKPAHECRVGRIKAVVWANKDKDGKPWYSVSITRSYKDGQGNWKQAATLGRDDLLPAAEIARLCWLWIAQQSGSKLDGTANASPNGTHQTEEVGDIPFY